MSDIDGPTSDPEARQQALEPALVNVRQLSRETGRVVDQVRESGRPVLVTSGGRPVAALMPLDPQALRVLENQVIFASSDVLRSLDEADRDLQSGRARPAEEVFAKVRAERGLMPTSKAVAETQRTSDVAELLEELAKAIKVAHDALLAKGPDTKSSVSAAAARLAAIRVQFKSGAVVKEDDGSARSGASISVAGSPAQIRRSRTKGVGTRGAVVSEPSWWHRVGKVRQSNQENEAGQEVAVTPGGLKLPHPGAGEEYGQASTSRGQQLLQRGMAAQVAGDLEQAANSYEEAAKSRDPDAAPIAEWMLGLLLLQQHRRPLALAALERAIASHHPKAAALAESSIAPVLYQEGDIKGAFERIQQAIDADDPDVRARAMSNQGILFEWEGDLERARGSYERAIATGDPDVAPMAARNLGLMLQGASDLEGAKSQLERAVAFDHAEQSPRALNNLGSLLEELGQLDAAREAYKRVLDWGHIAEGRKAATNLERLATAAALQSITSDEPQTELEAIIAAREARDDSVQRVLQILEDIQVYVLGHGSGPELRSGEFSTSDILHIDVDIHGENQVLVPVFTRVDLTTNALFRNPDWQSLEVVEVNSGQLLASIPSNIQIVLNPWSGLELSLKRNHQDAQPALSQPHA